MLKEEGFSLYELVLFTTIASILMVTASIVFETQKENAQIVSTRNKINIVTNALENYKKKNNSYPCPSRSTSITGDVDDGVASAECFLACPTGQACNTISVTGAVPFKTLGISRSLAFDDWDGKINYSVDRRFTQVGNCEMNGAITINDFTVATTTVNITTAAYVVASLGKNAKGAYQESGSMKNSCGSVADKDYVNCSYPSSTFVNGKTILNSTSSQYFDDIISWGVNSNYKSCPAGVPGCVVWMDASDVCSITYTAGSPNNVTKWYDKSKNANIGVPTIGAVGATFSSSSKQNNLNYFTCTSQGNTGFNLSNAALTSIVPLTDFTNIVVVRSDFINGAAMISASTVTTDFLSANDRFIGLNFGKIYTKLISDNIFATDTQCGTASPYCANSVPKIVSFSVDSIYGQSLYINGISGANSSVTTASAATGTKYWQIGLFTNLGGYTADIFENIVYNRVLSKAELKAVELYLANKWGLTVYNP